MAIKRKNILVFTTWSYKDGLIQAAALPYLKILADNTDGHIYLICLEQPHLDMTAAEIREAEAMLAKSRISLLRFKYHKNKLRAVIEWIFRMIYLIGFAYFKRISYFHSICAPASMLAWLVSRFKKVKLVVDSFEPHAEMMAEMGIWSRASTLFRISFALEKKVASSAGKFLAVSKHIPTYIRDHYDLEPPLDKILYRPLCVDPVLFQKSLPDYGLINKANAGGNIIGIYTGKTGGMYYDVELCNFIKECIQFWDGKFHVIICTSMGKEVAELLAANHIDPQFYTITFVSHDKIPQYLSLADFGMSFSRPSDARRYGCPTKNAEYWSMGLPVITTDAIVDDSDNLEKYPYLGVVVRNLELRNIKAELTQLNGLLAQAAHNAPLIRAFAIRERSFTIVRKVYKEVYA